MHPPRVYFQLKGIFLSLKYILCGQKDYQITNQPTFGTNK